MSNFFINLLAFLVAISFLVAFHEFGHYWVARRLNVKVLRFSIGFGPVLWSKILRNGVEFCISAVPMGGYVKMLDEREGEVAEHDLPFAFNRQNVWKRIAIVLAGPAANFLLAIILFVVVLMAGVQGVAPIVVEVKPDSPASHAGVHPHDEIIAVDGKPINTVMQLSRAIVGHLEDPKISLTLDHHQQPYTVALPLPSMQDSDEKNIYENMGLVLGLPAKLGGVIPDSPAEKAGLKAGDQIVSIDGQDMYDWTKVVTYISDHPEPMTLGVQRAGSSHAVHVIPEKKPNGKGFLGVHIDESLLRKEKLPFSGAISSSLKQTYEYSWLTLKMIYFMMSGQASLEHLSGPVSIAQVAGATAKVGFTYYLDFLAIISISLGVLNLLPIPMLDGGHLFFYLVEVLRRKPLSEATQMIGLRIGFAILVSLMLVAFYNDLLRLV